MLSCISKREVFPISPDLATIHFNIAVEFCAVLGYPITDRYCGTTWPVAGS